MSCKYHIEKNALNTCSICGDWLCEECIIEINNRNYCKSCIETVIQNNKENYNLVISNDKEDNLFSIDTTTKNIENIFINILSLIPGGGQIYLGNTIKGITLLSLFSFCLLFNYIFLPPVLIIPIFFYSFFDFFVTKRKLKNKNNIKNLDYKLCNIKQNPKFFKTFLVSLMPGCGQMYLGYTKYGFILSILSIGMITINFYPFVYIGLIIYLFSIFNTLNLRKQILNGICFEDDLKYLLNVINLSKKDNIKKSNTIIDKRFNKSEMEN